MQNFFHEGGLSQYLKGGKQLAAASMSGKLEPVTLNIQSSGICIVCLYCVYVLQL